MSYDLETAKKRLNITGSGQDAEIQNALDTGMAVAENYCDRKFPFASDQETFIYQTNQNMALSRYPLEGITSMTDGDGTAITSDQGLYLLDLEAGLLEFARGYSGDKLVVDYTGGYKVLPLDLELALWSIFDRIWAMAQATSGGGIVVGGIESVAITGVGSVKYSSGSSGDDAIGSDNSLISSMAYSVLKKFVMVLS